MSNMTGMSMQLQSGLENSLLSREARVLAAACKAMLHISRNVMCRGIIYIRYRYSQTVFELLCPAVVNTEVDFRCRQPPAAGVRELRAIVPEWVSCRRGERGVLRQGSPSSTVWHDPEIDSSNWPCMVIS